MQTRFDLNELNELHNKYSGQQQTFTSWGDMQAPASQSAYTPPTQPIIKQPQSYGLYDILQVLNPILTANAQEYIGNSSAVDYSKYGEGFSKEYIDEMLADKRFQRALQKYAIPNEGGYNNDPLDRGGETNMGITKKWYPNEDIKNLTRERANAILYRDYWKKININQLPQELSEVVFDNGVVQGQYQAIKNLQKALDVDVDGIIGPQTIEAVNSLNDYNLIREKIKNNATNVEEQNQQRHPEQGKFYKGHLRRFNSY